MKPYPKTMNASEGELLSDASEWVMANRDEGGAICPCCGQLARFANRSVYAAIAVWLIKLYWRCKGNDEFFYVNDVMPMAGGDYAKLQDWGLITPLTGEREDGSNRVGYWRITDLGAAFVEGRAVVPDKARYYNDAVVEFSEEMRDIRKALGKEFRYDELMTDR